VKYSIAKAVKLKKVKEAIDEAEYLYQKMEETLKTPMDFRSNLNAFLSRSRAVTWVLKNQLNDNPSFASWYSAQEKIMKENELMAFFVVARNISEKEYPISPKSSGYMRHITVNADGKRGFAITGEGEPIWIERTDEGDEKRTHAKEFDDELSIVYYFDDPQPPKLYQNLQVIDLCGLYLKALQSLIAEATQKFDIKEEKKEVKNNANTIS
jgi:hypothetical protein